MSPDPLSPGGTRENIRAGLKGPGLKTPTGLQRRQGRQGDVPLITLSPKQEMNAAVKVGSGMEWGGGGGRTKKSQPLPLTEKR